MKRGIKQIILGLASTFIFYPLTNGYVEGEFFRRARVSGETIVSLENIPAYLGVGQKVKDLGNLMRLGIPVPEGFVVTRRGFKEYKKEGKVSDYLWDRVLAGIKELERKTGKRFGGEDKPLILSVRSAPPEKMPGILPTVVNLGINDSNVQGLVKLGGGGEKGLFFAYDTYRRFIESFVSTVYSGEIEEDYFLIFSKSFYRVKISMI